MDDPIDRSLRTPDGLAWRWPELSETQRNAILMRGQVLGRQGKAAIIQYKGRLYRHDPEDYDADLTPI